MEKENLLENLLRHKNISLIHDDLELDGNKGIIDWACDQLLKKDFYWAVFILDHYESVSSDRLIQASKIKNHLFHEGSVLKQYILNSFENNGEGDGDHINDKFYVNLNLVAQGGQESIRFDIKDVIHNIYLKSDKVSNISLIFNFQFSTHLNLDEVFIKEVRIEDEKERVLSYKERSGNEESLAVDAGRKTVMWDYQVFNIFICLELC